MLDAATTTQLKSLPRQASSSRSSSSRPSTTRPSPPSSLDLLEDTAALSDKITVRRGGRQPRAVRPSRSPALGTDVSVPSPASPWATSSPRTSSRCCRSAATPSKAAPEVIEQVQGLDGEYHFETYMSLTCQNCPDVVQALNAMSIINPRITHTAIDGALFQDEIEAKQILAVPTVYLNGELFDSGRMSLEQIVAKLDTGAVARQAARHRREGARSTSSSSAAVRPARRPPSTRHARASAPASPPSASAARCSTPWRSRTSSPCRTPRARELATALEQHVLEYGVDVMTLQQAKRLVPAGEDGLVTVELDNGSALHARTVVLATGARWRNMNVPGESEYRNKGVTYCPHCDGPLFKGKRVAVIGGGNSGVEAAIDLAGIVGHVTLIEFDDAAARRRRAPAQAAQPAQRRHHRQRAHHRGARRRQQGHRPRRTTTGPRATSTASSSTASSCRSACSPTPSGSPARSSCHRAARSSSTTTAAPRCAACSPPATCTTVPFKQIVISMGAGATAGLSAFDYLIRTSAPAAEELVTV